MTSIFRLIYFVGLILTLTETRAQVDTGAFFRVEPLLDQIFEEDGVHIRFKRICLNATWDQLESDNGGNCYRSGFSKYYTNGTFQVDLGVSRLLSDGILDVVTDEIDKIMYVDSVAKQERTFRRLYEISDEEYENIDEFEDDQDSLLVFRAVNIGFADYRAYEEIFLSGEYTVYVFNAKESKLIGWKEGTLNEEDYTLYLIDRIERLSDDDQFDIELPSYELQEYMGYKVEDLRFKTFNY